MTGFDRLQKILQNTSYHGFDLTFVHLSADSRGQILPWNCYKGGSIVLQGMHYVRPQQTNAVNIGEHLHILFSYEKFRYEQYLDQPVSKHKNVWSAMLTDSMYILIWKQKLWTVCLVIMVIKCYLKYILFKWK